MVLGAVEKIYERLCLSTHTSELQSRDALLRSAKVKLRKNPLDLEALRFLTCRLLLDERVEECLDRIEFSKRTVKSDAVLSQIAGYAQVLNGNEGESIQHFRIAVDLEPHLHDCWTMLGKIHEKRGMPIKAISYYRRAIVFDRSDYESAVSMAGLLAKRNQLRDAIHTLRVCLLDDQRSPRLNLALARLLNRRAIALKRERRWREHKRVLREVQCCLAIANAVSPSTETLIEEAKVQQRMGNYESARDTFEKAVERDPNSSQAISHLASANVDCGEMDVALDQFDRSMKLSPDRASNFFRYSRAKRFHEGDDSQLREQQIRAALRNSNLQRRQAVQLHFALAKILDDLGRYDEAWKHYDTANRLKPGHSKSGVDRPEFRKKKSGPLKSTAESNISFYTPDFFSRYSGVGVRSSVPIFVVGMPRSGTTLTEQILCSHPSVAGAGELKLIEEIRAEMSSKVEPSYPESMLHLPIHVMQNYAQYYLRELDQHRQNELFVTDKMPTNFIHLGMIATLFPDATIIHCQRNPMDVFVSSYCQNLSAPFCDLGQLLVYYRSYVDLMDHWRENLPIKIHEVKYESLVSDPEREIRRLIGHCGLPWDDRCLDFQNNGRAVHTPSKWQVRQPIYASSVEKWRRFEPHLREIADALGV